MQKHFRSLVLIGACLALAACSERAPPPATYAAPTVVAAAAPASVAAPAAPVIVNAAPAAAHSGLSDMLVGGAMGYMLANGVNGAGRGGGGGAADAHHTTVNKTVINKTVVVREAAPPPKTAPRPSFASGYGAKSAYAPATTRTAGAPLASSRTTTAMRTSYSPSSGGTRR